MLEQARGIDLVQIIKLLAPKLKFDPNPSVFEYAPEMEVFLKHLSVQLLLSLESLHKNGIIYKDLKASHVFIDQALRVTLIDFGMCETTSDGTTIKPAGTFHAMSPEMLLLFERSLANGKADSVSFAHDYFTLGVLLLEFV